MFQDQFNDDYYIEQVDAPSPNFPYQYFFFLQKFLTFFFDRNCTDEEFQRLVDQINPIQNKTISKRFIKYELLN